MKKKTLEILACPECKGELELRPEVEEGEEILEGELICKSCGERYIITEGIPDLRPKEMRESGGD
ncbi:MAG: methytransferase partner Trm112 [Archaeoglobi archaeon]|nr:methytransferase partner Trm112 [Candidatus Mnemosynella sp.]